MPISLSEYSIHHWIVTNGIRTETGAPLNFKDHRFLFDIYRDQNPKIVCLKAAQVGFTTLAVLKSFWTVKYKGLDAIYTMPTANDIHDFVGGKVNRIIDQNQVLQEFVKDRDTIEQKRVSQNIIYYRGTWTDKAALMVSSDLNIHDEEDRSKQSIIQQYSSRQQHSKFKYEWHFSNPSVPGNGVSRYWDLSDQKSWFIKCAKCQKEQTLSWPESIDRERKCFQCTFCHTELSEAERRKGQWVKKFHDKEYSGYWISLLMAPWVKATEILNYHETKGIEFFYNFVLGLPYVGQGNTVSPENIFKNCTAKINKQENVVIGCDSGIKKHYVLGNSEGLFYYGVTEDWATIRDCLRRYPRSVAVIDAMPDITGPRMLKDEFPGRVFLNHYVKDRKTYQMIKWGENSEYGNVTSDRNRLLQTVVDEFADGRIPLQGTKEDWREYYDHWSTMFRVTTKSSIGVDEHKWETSNGEDHWAHATAYWRIGISRTGTDKGALLGSGSDFKVTVGPAISPYDKIDTNPLSGFVMEEEINLDDYS